MANQLQISIQLSHPDAFFYDLQPSREGVSGMFQGDDVIPFDVSRLEYLEAARKLHYLGDYNELPGGKVWVSDSYEGRAEDEESWIEYTCEEYRIANEILKEVFRLRLEHLLKELFNSSFINTNHERLKVERDADFCEAIVRLADIIRAMNPDWTPEYEKVPLNLDAI